MHPTLFEISKPGFRGFLLVECGTVVEARGSLGVHRSRRWSEVQTRLALSGYTIERVTGVPKPVLGPEDVTPIEVPTDPPSSDER